MLIGQMSTRYSMHALTRLKATSESRQDHTLERRYVYKSSSFLGMSPQLSVGLAALLSGGILLFFVLPFSLNIFIHCLLDSFIRNYVDRMVPISGMVSLLQNTCTATVRRRMSGRDEYAAYG